MVESKSNATGGGTRFRSDTLKVTPTVTTARPAFHALLFWAMSFRKREDDILRNQFACQMKEGLGNCQWRWLKEAEQE